METDTSAEQVQQGDQAQAASDVRQDRGIRQVPAGEKCRPAPEGEDLAAGLTRIEKSLDRIVDHLYHTQRVEQIREFSLSDLASSLSLVVSVVFIVAAVLSLLRTDVKVGLAWATVALLGAIAMQGLSLALSRLSRRK